MVVILSNIIGNPLTTSEYLNDEVIFSDGFSTRVPPCLDPRGVKRHLETIRQDSISTESLRIAPIVHREGAEFLVGNVVRSSRGAQGDDFCPMQIRDEPVVVVHHLHHFVIN